MALKIHWERITQITIWFKKHWINFILLIPGRWGSKKQLTDFSGIALLKVVKGVVINMRCHLHAWISTNFDTTPHFGEEINSMITLFLCQYHCKKCLWQPNPLAIWDYVSITLRKGIAGTFADHKVKLLFIYFLVKSNSSIWNFDRHLIWSLTSSI